MISIIGILERPLELNPAAFYIIRGSLFTYLRGIASTWGLLTFDNKAPPGAALAAPLGIQGCLAPRFYVGSSSL
jgi:hypothetical protein